MSLIARVTCEAAFCAHRSCLLQSFSDRCSAGQTGHRRKGQQGSQVGTRFR